MIGISILLAIAMQDEPVRLRTLCPNGAVVMVERMPKEPAISVQLWASAKNVRESKVTHGWRHLLEHFVALGPKRDLDGRLERAGCFLRARTYRDAMQFQVDVGPGQLKLGISAINEILKPIQVSETDLKREIGIMAEEYATYDDSAKFSMAAWNQAFGVEGLDPFGDPDSFAKASPEALHTLQRKQFYPENLVLVIAGPVDIAEATRLGTSAIGVQQGAVNVPDNRESKGTPGRAEADAFGEGRAAMVGGFNRPSTVGALAFALAVASEIEGSFVSYTPSESFGLVLVGQTEKQSGIGLRIDQIKESEWPTLFARGKLLARQWVLRYLKTAQGVGYIRGLLLTLGKGNRPESMIDALDALTFEQFKSSGLLFSRDRAVTVAGR